MSSQKNEKPSSLEELFDEIDGELEEEKTSSMPEGEQILAEIARRILRLERDMTMPGSATQASSRIERLAKFIEEESF